MIGMEIELRPYQQEFIAKVQAELGAGTKRICGVAPCGSGKTVMAGWLIREWLRLGKRIIFLVHRQELVEQAARTFERLGLTFGLIASGAPETYERPLQIAMQQTLVKRLKKIDAPDILICDECHHIAADSYRRIICFWKKATLIGLTATPERTGGERLGAYFQTIITSATANQLIGLGALTHYSYIAPTLVRDSDLRGIRLTGGDYNKGLLANFMMKNELIGDIVANYQEYSDGDSAICFCVNVEHSRLVAERFCSAGILAVHVDGDTNKGERHSIVEDFRAGEIKILCNVGLFCEGFDVPGVHTVILARPTRSLILYIQQTMRALRIDPHYPKKQAKIIDHVENYVRHGYPTDAHSWSLEKNDERLKECVYCHKMIPWGAKVCSYCGLIQPYYGTGESKPRHWNLALKDGELGEIYSSRQRLDFIADYYSNCLKAAAQRGYNPLWAVHQTVKKVESGEELQVLEGLSKAGKFCQKVWRKEQDKRLKKMRRDSVQLSLF